MRRLFFAANILASVGATFTPSEPPAARKSAKVAAPKLPRFTPFGIPQIVRKYSGVDGLINVASERLLNAGNLYS